MKKRIKMLWLISLIVCIGASIYYKHFLLTVGLILALIFNLYIFIKWKKIKVKNNFLLRTIIASDIVLFCFFVLLFRMIQLQLFESDSYKEAVNKQVTVERKEQGERGDIFDKNGRGLAYSINMYDLVIDPENFIKDSNSAEALKELMSKGYIKGNYKATLKNIEKLGEDKRRYKRVNKYVDDVEKEEIDKILEKWGLPGKKIIFLDARKERRYYRKDLYFFLVGNTGYKKGTEKEGTFGLELYYENYLKGEKRNRRIPSMRNLAVGLPMSTTQSKINLDGKDLHLTVDNELQYILNDEVKKQFKKTDSEEAYAVMMDPNNGKVLATSFFTKNKNNVINPIFQFQVEPGSIFKPLIVAAAMNEGKINRYTTFDIGDGKIKKYNHIIRESSRHTKGILTTEEVLKKSSNVGMVLIGDKFTNEEFDGYLRQYGFYEKTGVDYPYEKKTRAIPTKRWDGLKKSTMSFGQGIVVTPIQMITAFSSVINGGNLYQPYIVEKITDKDGTVVRRNLPQLKRQVIKKDVSDTIKDILEKAVEDGTVIKAQVPGYRIGGKTGTAQFSEHGKYVKKQYLSSVIGFFPVDKPKYTILVMLFKPQGEHWYDRTGGSAAAPVLGEIIKRITKSKNIYSENVENIKVRKLDQGQKSLNEDVILSEMPDLKGYSARQVANLFKNLDIKVEIVGSGIVVEQVPEKGKSMEEIKKIKVKLK